MEFENTSVENQEVAELENTQTEDVTSEVVDNSTEEIASPQQSVEKPIQSAEQNAIFAKIRREAEAKAEAKAKAETDRLLSALKGYGYEGSPQQIADLLEAQQTQKPVEEVRAEREERERQDAEKLQTQQELEHYKSIALQSMVKEGIDKINKAFPDAKIKDIKDLGEPFVKLISAGLDEIEAFEVLQNRKARTEVPKPPITGAVNSASTQEKDFYTQEEVDRLSDKDLDNPKIFEAVRKSMLKWK